MQKANFLDSVLKVSERNLNKIKKFCQPILNTFSVNYFYYYKITHDGNYSTIASNLKWGELFFDSNFHRDWPYYRDPSLFKNEIKFFIDENEANFSPILISARESFNINLCLQIMNKTASGLEGFGFGTDKSIHKDFHMVINEMNLFYLFVQRFKENFSRELAELEDYQVSMKEELGSLFLQKAIEPYILAKNDFTEKMGIKKLSAREEQVIQYLLKCHSVTEIAQKLSLSKRTVETYMENIKNKLNCYSKAELIEKAKFLASIHPQLI